MSEDTPKTCLVCEREIPLPERILESYEGHLCCFCSPRCQARFEADPERYLGETVSLSHPPGYW